MYIRIEAKCYFQKKWVKAKIITSVGETDLTNSKLPLIDHINDYDENFIMIMV